MNKFILLIFALLCFQTSAEIKIADIPSEIGDHPRGADILSKEFNENAISAKQKYAGKTLVIVATAISVDENNDGKPVVTVEGENAMEHVNLIFKKVDDNIVNLKKGSFIEALCSSPGKADGYLQLSNCEMIVPN
jgi:hypothetical protein